jgi:hypothetical protein
LCEVAAHSDIAAAQKISGWHALAAWALELGEPQHALTTSHHNTFIADCEHVTRRRRPYACHPSQRSHF